jgi:putative FmdB family regulatory protein
MRNRPVDLRIVTDYPQRSDDQHGCGYVEGSRVRVCSTVPYHWQSPAASASRTAPAAPSAARTRQLRPEDPALPTYQYRCTECGHSFEQFQSFTDDALTVCPECGGRLRKMFNAVGVVFKGSGFYRTDSRESSTSAESPAAEKAPASSDTPAKPSDTPSKSSDSSSGASTTAASTGSGSGSTST